MPETTTTPAPPTATIALNTLERYLLIDLFRAPDRRGTGKEGRAIRRLMKAIDEAGWRAQVKEWKAADACATCGAKGARRIQDGVNALEDDELRKDYALAEAEVEFLREELTKLDQGGKIPMSGGDLWIDLIDTVEAAHKSLKAAS